MKINLRESLGRLDLLTDNKYDLRNTYDSSNISNDKKKKLAESLNNNASAKSIYNILTEDFEDDDFDSEFDRRYDVFSYYSNSVSLLDNFYGLEDDLHTDDFEEVKDRVWEKIQRGLYVTAADSKTGNTVSLNPNNYDSDWDDAYRVFDDLDELSPLHESLNEEDNFNSDEYERKHILRLAKSVEEASKRKGMNISNLKKTAKRYIENHKDTKNKKELDELIKAYKSLDEKEECLEEDTIKQNGKWVNKGEEGTHGKFKTKKAADAQRKAMFANGYKAEALEESLEDEVVKQAKADAKQLKSNYRKQKNVAGAFNSLGYKYYSYNDVYEKNAGKYTIVFREIVPGKFEFSVFNDAERTSTPWDVVVLFKSNLKEANYGGAYDIDPEMFWTKDDLIEFSDAVCDKLTEKFGYQYDIADVGAESNNDMYILIEDTTHGIEADVSFRIKMSRIRSPRDLMKYLDTVVSQFVKKFEEEYQYYDFDESLKLNEGIDVKDSMVAKEFNYTLNYGGKSSDISSAVIVIPDAVKFDDKLSDLVIYAEDENGKVINFRSVKEANEWINKYKDSVNLHWERDELHATPSEFVDESLTEDVSKPDFVVGFYAGPVDDETLELVNPKKISQVDVSADELRAKYGKNVDKLLNDYTSQTVDKLKSTNSWLKTLILNFAEEKARKTGKLDDKFRNEERKFLETGIYMEKRLEEVNYPFEDGIKKLSKQLGKMLLPKRENLTEDVYDEESDFGDGSVEEGDTFIEDGRTWSWIERIAGPIHLDFDNWAVWSARDWDYIQEKIRPILLNKEELTVETLTKIYDEAEVAYFVVDEDTGFIDWGPVESQTEAQDFLNGKVEDWENDEYDESLQEGKILDGVKSSANKMLSKHYTKKAMNALGKGNIQKFKKNIDKAVTKQEKTKEWGKIQDNIKDASNEFNNSKEKAQNRLKQLNDKSKDESLKESKDLKEWWTVDLSYTDGEDEYTFEVNGEDVIDYITDTMYDNGEYPDFLEGQSDEEIEAWLDDKENYPKFRAWVEEKFDELFKKYEDDILDYFREKAEMEHYDELDAYDDLKLNSWSRYDNGSGMTDKDFL